MKGYRVVLPKRKEDGGLALARGMKIIDEDGNELKHVMDAKANFSVDEPITVTVVLPVSNFSHDGDQQ